MKNRFSCRYYLPKPIDKEIIEQIIDAARCSPSGNNMQPWEKVYCITGALKDTISREMVQAHEEAPEAYSAQYLYYPAGPIPAQYARRRFEFGKHYYTPLGIDHGDLKGRARVSTRQYEWFDGPVVFIFTINNGLTQGSWLDVGYFLQSINIAARARGLETVSQESTAKYQLILRKHLPIGDSEVVALGMTMGYPDLEKVAKFSAKQPKREVSDIIEFFGF
ncbi:nitroreductase [Mycena rosella]|uniref:Nitroreductase n=1 Tax=Mycena rosella TaxID=1033263 RepID=A0AAD7H170_MYCRO|nr:nitroreductase [Mycena rosella]